MARYLGGLLLVAVIALGVLVPIFIVKRVAGFEKLAKKRSFAASLYPLLAILSATGICLLDKGTLSSPEALTFMVPFTVAVICIGLAIALSGSTGRAGSKLKQKPDNDT